MRRLCRHRTPGSALLITLVALSSCGRTDAGHRFHVEQVDGVPTAITEGGPRYSEPLFRLEEVVRLRQDEQVPESLLEAPGTFLPGPRGTLLISEVLHPRLLVFDRDGTFVRILVREGSGPGEARQISTFRVDGDVVIITDLMLGRITQMRVDGTVLGTMSTAELGKVDTVRLLADGRWQIGKRYTDYSGEFARGAVGVMVTEGAGGDTLALVETPVVVTGKVTRGSGGRFSVSTMAMTGQPARAFLPDGSFVLSAGDRPVFSIYAPNGTLERVVRLKISERVMTPELRTAYLEGLVDQAAFYGREIEPDPKALENLPERPGWWATLTVDDVGHTWLCDVTSNPAWVSDRPWRHHVFDPEGRWLGEAEVPSLFVRVHDGLLYALVADRESGARSAVVYRLIPTAPGFSYP